MKPKTKHKHVWEEIVDYLCVRIYLTKVLDEPHSLWLHPAFKTIKRISGWTVFECAQETRPVRPYKTNREDKKKFIRYKYTSDS